MRIGRDVKKQPFATEEYFPSRRAALANMDDESFLQAFVQQINASAPGRNVMRKKAAAGDQGEIERLQDLRAAQRNADSWAKRDVYKKKPETIARDVSEALYFMKMAWLDSPIKSAAEKLGLREPTDHLHDYWREEDARDKKREEKRKAK